MVTSEYFIQQLDFDILYHVKTLSSIISFMLVLLILTGAQNITVCKEDGSSFVLQCPTNTWFYLTESFYGKKLHQDNQVCNH